MNQKILNDYYENNKPILGVCLGMQLFASHSSEDGRHNGLNWISGNVEKIDKDFDSKGVLDVILNFK